MKHIHPDLVETDAVAVVALATTHRAAGVYELSGLLPEDGFTRCVAVIVDVWPDAVQPFIPPYALVQPFFEPITYTRRTSLVGRMGALALSRAAIELVEQLVPGELVEWVEWPAPILPFEARRYAVAITGGRVIGAVQPMTSSRDVSSTAAGDRSTS